VEPAGIALALRYYRDQGPVRIGVIGLGTGTLASYARPGDAVRYYEINPAVTRLAETSFTFLRDARERGATIEVAPGDGRLSLAGELARSAACFDLLVLDAFSSDAIPAHLLTREAFEIYQARLCPQGAIVVHVTNGYLQLAPVVWGAAKSLDMQSLRIISPSDPTRSAAAAEWMIVTRNRDLIRQLRPQADPRWNQQPPTLPQWTDQRHNLFEILK
jgi:spermidine synthase